MFAPTSTHSSNNLALSKPKRGCPLLEPVAKSVSDRPNRSPAHEYKSYKCSRRLRPTHQPVSRHRRVHLICAARCSKSLGSPSKLLCVRRSEERRVGKE